MRTRTAVVAVSAFGLAALFAHLVPVHAPVLADQPAHARTVDAGCAVTSAMRFDPCADLDTSGVIDLRGVEVDLAAVADV